DRQLRRLGRAPARRAGRALCPATEGEQAGGDPQGRQPRRTVQPLLTHWSSPSVERGPGFQRDTGRVFGGDETQPGRTALPKGGAARRWASLLGEGNEEVVEGLLPGVLLGVQAADGGLELLDLRLLLVHLGDGPLVGLGVAGQFTQVAALTL